MPRWFGRRAAVVPPPAQESRTLAQFQTSFLASDYSYSSGAYLSPTYRSALTIPAVRRASTLLSDLIGQLPWQAYRDGPDGVALRVEPTPVLLSNPSPPETTMSVFSSLALDYLLEGNAIAVITARNASGYPTAILPVPAQYVQIRYRGEYEFGLAPTSSVEYRIGSWVGGPYDVIHVRNSAPPGALRGFGVIELHMQAIGIAVAQEKQAASISGHGVPTGLLKATSPDVTPVDLAAAKAAWLVSQSSRTIAALSPSIEFQPLAWSPSDAQMIEARKFSVQEIALMFGIPGRYLGVEAGSLTYSTPNLDAVDLLKFGLAGHLTRFEQELSRHFPRGTWVKANVEGLLRADVTSRYASYAVALASGFLTVDEVRKLEDLPPLSEPPEPVVSEQSVAVDASVLDETVQDDQGSGDTRPAGRAATTCRTTRPESISELLLLGLV